jgi:hypothetical protein
MQGGISMRRFIMLIGCLFLFTSAVSAPDLVVLSWDAPSVRADGSPLDEEEIWRYIILWKRLSDNKKYYFISKVPHLVLVKPQHDYVVKVLCQDIHEKMSRWSEGVYFNP